MEALRQNNGFVWGFLLTNQEVNIYKAINSRLSCVLLPKESVVIKRMPLLLVCLLLLPFTFHNAMAVETRGEQQEQKPSTLQIPIGQTEESIITGQGQTGTEVFGLTGGNIHPFLLFSEQWTDNLYYTDSNKVEDFVTSISPGIWFALPANREKLLDIGTTTTAPGGLEISRATPESIRKFQGYLYYAPEFVFYSENPQHDTDNHKAEGLLQYNFNMGLTVNLVDQFNINNEPNNNGIVDRIDKYADNLLDFILVYETPERFKFRIDFSNYDLNYDDQVNDYRNRNDNSYDFYIFYKVRPKTSMFVEYEFADIRYDEFPDSDSTENRYYAGLQYNVTEKTNGSIKFGYAEKDFKIGSSFDESNFSSEIQIQHNFTPKRALKLTGVRRYNESTMIGSMSFLTTEVTAAWLQRLTERWSGTLRCSYSTDEYDGLFSFGGSTDNRSDTTFSVATATRYKLRDWLLFDLGYIFRTRNSNFKLFDYSTNTIFFRFDLDI